MKKKKTRRGKKKKQKNLNIYYCNVNGFRSKQDSIKNIIEQVQPKIVALCETKLESGKTIKSALPGYEICSRKKKAGEKGIAVCVKKQTFKSVLDVTITNHEDIVAVRIEMAQCVARIILGYAPQETDPVELRELFFTELEIEISQCRLADEMPIVLGDLNSKIQIRGGVVEAITPNGKMLLELINNQELKVLNFHDRCVGKWTYVVRTTGFSSVLDYAISNETISEATEEILIDEECLFCPFNIKKKKGRQERQFSDHNAIVINLSIPYESKTPKNVPKSWRITKDGLEKLNHITTENFGFNAQGSNIQEMYNAFERGVAEKMNECFKVRKRTHQFSIHKDYLPMYTKLTRFARGGKAQRRVAKQYIAHIAKANVEKVADAQKKKIQTTLSNLTVNNTFSPNSFWNLCKKARKGDDMGTSIETDDGNELFGSDMIRNEYMKEFKHRLRKREIDEDLKNYESQVELLCDMHLENATEEKGPPYTKEEYVKVKNHLKKGKSSGRDNFPAEVFIEAGQQLEDTILNMFNIIKKENEIPDQWTEVQVSTMYKNKGKKKRLVNQRGIFLKQVLSKMYGKLNMNRADKGMKSIDKCQAGGTDNRSTADQTFLLRAAVDHAKYLDQPLFLTLYDYSQCFDSLWLSDCLLSLIKVGVEKEVVSILKNLNEKCRIVVKTPVGITEEFEMPSLVQQGSVSGGALCVASLAEIFEEDLGMGFQIGDAILRALAFVDDIATLSKDHINAYVAHRSVVWFSAKKRLTLNALKCVLLCINIKSHHVVPRLKIDGTAIRTVGSAPYLGDIFNESGNNKDLIKDRVKKGKACIVNAMSLCSEITLGMYTINTLLLLYESVFLQVVLYNAQSWSNLTNSNIQELQVVQLKYLKRMLQAPSSTSNPLTFIETGTLPVENVIHIRQLNFLHHILTLNDDDPVKTTYYEQLKYPFESNWGNTIDQIKLRYGVSETDEEIPLISKGRWKRLVKTKVRSCVFQELAEKARLQRCTENITLPSILQKQEYLTKLPSANARKIFHIRTGTINLKYHRKYMYGDDNLCRLCQREVEDVNHVVNECPAIPRGENININTTKYNDLMEISNRCIIFDDKINDNQKDDSDAINAE